MKKHFSFAAGTLFLLAGNANADVLLFDISRNGVQAWNKALAAHSQQEYGRFDLDDTYINETEGIDGPLGSEGNSSGTVPQGLIPENIFIDSNLNPWGEGGRAGRGVGGIGLAGIPPWENLGRAIVANWFVDSFDVYTESSLAITAVSFNTISLLGSNTVDLSVYLENGETKRFNSLDASAYGNTYGIIATDGDVITRFNLYDSTGNGAEGINRETIFYTIPTPPTAALFLLGLSIKRRRRRLKDLPCLVFIDGVIK